METHPVTIIIGIICTIFLVALVGLGMACTAYKMEPERYPLFKPYYEYAKTKKVC